jgi:hypothetical protein
LSIEQEAIMTKGHSVPSLPENKRTREQMLYMKHLRHIASTVSSEDALAILDRVPTAPIMPEDALDATGQS